MISPYMLAVDFIIVLFIREYLRVLGVHEPLALIYALLTTIIVHILASVDLKITSKVLSFKYELPLVITADDVILLSSIRVEGRSMASITINVSGFLISLIISLTLLINYAGSGFINVGVALTTASSILFLTLIHNRLVVVGNNFIGVPIIRSIAITVPIGLILSIMTNPHVGLGLTYLVSFLSLLLGVDVANLKNMLRYTPNKVSIGGMGPLDALFLIPAITSILAYMTSSLLH